MRINFYPVRRDAGLTLSRAGDVLTVAGTAFDFTALQEGDVLPRAAVGSPWLHGDVTRIDGRITLDLILPVGPNAPQATRFPDPVLDPADGPIPLPLYTSPEAPES